MGARRDFFKSSINQAKFQAALQTSQKNYPMTKVVWKTLHFDQKDTVLAIDGQVKVLSFDNDGKLMNETRSTYQYCYLMNLGREAAEKLAKSLYDALQSYIDKSKQMTDDLITAELVNYGEEFGYFNIKIKGGPSIILDNGNGLIVPS